MSSLERWAGVTYTQWEHFAWVGKMMSEIKQMYTVGQRVVGTVDRVLPYGVFVCLDDGSRAYILSLIHISEPTRPY